MCWHQNKSYESAIARRPLRYARSPINTRIRLKSSSSPRITRAAESAFCVTCRRGLIVLSTQEVSQELNGLSKKIGEERGDMLSNWGKHTARTPAELNNETELEALEAVGDEERYNTFTSLVFDACRAGNANALENILTVDPSYATQELHGYEGSDLYDVVKSEDKKCYTFTGQIKDGFFYPLHVAAEGGFKETCLLLFKYGAKHDIPDSTGRTPEQKVNRDAKWAFYEHRGLKFEACC